jgi:pimeloyl-ACP methyl ester carboxylesterase
MWAALTHHMQPERLGYISKMIPKTLILSGDQDDLVRPSNSEYLKKHMLEAEYLKWKDTGHVLSGQRVERFNVQLEAVFLEGEARARLGFDE